MFNIICSVNNKCYPHDIVISGISSQISCLSTRHRYTNSNLIHIYIPSSEYIYQMLCLSEDDYKPKFITIKLLMSILMPILILVHLIANIIYVKS